MATQSQVYIQIQRLITDGGRGNPAKTSYIKTKLVLKGIDPDKWGPHSQDSPEILEVLEKLSKTLIGV